jgi:hypothetical protein|tara:strand:- start:1119 stop:1253 length:135 start_codon:yes stop_codon:yes gene_type:complete
MKKQSFTPIALGLVSCMLIYKDHMDEAIVIWVIYAIYRIFIKAE